jgi:hypothetical protein
VAKRKGTFTQITMFGPHAQEVYWCTVPRGMTEQEAARSQERHGPFPSVEAAQADAERVLFAGVEVVDAPGMRPPPWDKAYCHPARPAV